MLSTATPERKTLQLSLSCGIALIVLSMLFLGRDLRSTSFIVQAASVLAVPAVFYAIGLLVYRYLDAPLAAPGIVATGAWLVGVGLIHLYDQRTLLPQILQPYYWLIASLLAGVLITLSGHRARIWMLVPLVPLVQANMMWAGLAVLRIAPEWQPALSFLLVLAWWEAPKVDQRWRAVYRGSAALLSLFLLIFTIWLPLTTPRSLMVTWGAGAAVVAILGLRHGWVKLGPLAIAMLTCATVWGLPSSVWAPAWLILGVGTVLFMEQQAGRADTSKNNQAVVISRTLAVLLTAAAAGLAQLAPVLGVPMHPLACAGIVAVAGLLLTWLGFRRNLRVAAHAGLWLLAGAWADVYFVAVPDSGTLGLWLALFAACALLVERLLTSTRKEKRKSARPVLETLALWPVADLAIGLTTIVLLRSALDLSTTPPWILTVTFGVIVGIWIAAGLVYRMPVLLHVALWIAPIPYALLLIILAPSIWTLPLLGVAWQLLGALLLVLGHSSPRYRPAMLSPFFIVGYVLLGFGFTLASGSPTLMPLALALLVLASIATSAAVITGYHPTWTVFVGWLIPPEVRPFAFRHVHHLFLILSAWLAAIWLHLMLGTSGLSLPRQGLSLVVLACLWFALGSRLGRLPGVVAWPVASAGWFMWLVGLLEVFFSPTEALITVIVGLVISGVAWRRTREVIWIPVVILQVMFTTLQLAWMLALPGRFELFLVAVGVMGIGMFYERRAQRSGRMAALSGAAFALTLWCAQPDLQATLVLTGLALIAVMVYRNWKWLWAVYFGAAILIFQNHVQPDWPELLLAGIVHWTIGVALIHHLRPRRFRTLGRVLLDERDWATPFLAVGVICCLSALAVANYTGSFALIECSLILALLFAVTMTYLKVFQSPYVSLGCFGVALVALASRLLDQPFSQIGNSLLTLSSAMIIAAILIRTLIVDGTSLGRVRQGVLWLKPFLMAANVLSATSAVMLLVVGTAYPVTPFARIANGLLLLLFAAQMYFELRRLHWLWIAFTFAAYCWLQLMGLFYLQGSAWLTFPLGLALFGIARVSEKPQQTTLDRIATLVWLVGFALSVDRAHLISGASLSLIVHWLGLLGYGWFGGRRLPFVGGLLLAVGGIVYVIAQINIWFVPFIGGSLLLSLSLMFEVQREPVERWLSRWQTHWQTWR